MVIQCFFFIFLFLSYLLAICCSGTQPKPSSGPFKSSFVSVRDCSNPSKPYLKNPPMIYNPSVLNIDGKKMLGGNLTVFREFKDLKMNLKCFAWHNGRWRQALGFNNPNCHSSMLHFTFVAFGVKHDQKTCTIKKGSYNHQNLDINKLQHIWVPAIPYGRVVWRAELLYKDGVVTCKEFDTITEPAG